jgi:hypothetical protein
MGSIDAHEGHTFGTQGGAPFFGISVASGPSDHPARACLICWFRSKEAQGCLGAFALCGLSCYFGTSRLSGIQTLQNTLQAIFDGAFVMLQACKSFGSQELLQWAQVARSQRDVCREIAGSCCMRRMRL